MSTTSVRMSSATRDRLGALAREEFGGISQEAALNKLIDEHEMRQVHDAFARLRSDSVQWAEHTAETALTEVSSADGLGDPRDEYPEHNS